MKIHRLCSLAIGLVLTAQLLGGPKGGRFDIYWVDVEGGAATLMVSPAGESILVDTGNPGLRDPNRIANVLTRVAGLRRLDHLIITHYHRDHYGGAEALSKLIPIGTVYDNGRFDGMPDDPGKAYFEFKREKHIVIDPGYELKLKQREGTALKIKCLGTRRQFIAAPSGTGDNSTICATARSKKRDGSDNANSVVCVVDFGPFRFFDAGDLTWNQETRLVCPKNRVGKVDVYQVTHHGLDSSNNPVVLQSLEPHVAIMNNGKTKGCTPEVFANLKAAKSIDTVYQLHKNIRPDGATNNVDEKYIANIAKDETGNIIHLSVAKDGKSYFVSIPSKKHRQEFKTKMDK